MKFTESRFPYFFLMVVFLSGVDNSIAQSGNISTPIDQGMSPERLSRIFDPIHEAVNSDKIGSAVGLIARNGKIVFLESAGQIGNARLMPTDAITRLSSITKSLTAAAVMILHERNLIQLDDRVSDYLPEYEHVKVAAPNEAGGETLVSPEEPMTIHHLLTHQSGIASDGNPFWNIWDQAKTVREFSSLIAQLPLEFHPGREFRYGQMGSSYELLAAIVEVISGESFRDFIESEILNPLQMVDTYFWVPESKRDRLSAIYAINERGELIKDSDMGEEAPPHQFWSGGGGLRSTVEDYFRFAQCLLNGGEFAGVRILTEESVEMMTTNQVIGGAWNEETGWGYGVAIQLKETTSGESVDSYGWNGGTGTRYIVDPAEKLIAIIFIPTRPGTPNVSGLRNRFIDSAFQAIDISYR